MTFNGFCEGLYPNNQGGDTLFSLVRKLNELLPEMIEGIEEGGNSDINNLKLYYDTPSQSVQLQGVEGKVISEISAAPFIKDGMLNAVENNETEHIITLTFNTDAGKQPITLNYDSLWEGMETSLKGYTDSQVATLSSQVVKGIRVSSVSTTLPIQNGVVTLPVVASYRNGLMSDDMFSNLNRGYVFDMEGECTSNTLTLSISLVNPMTGTVSDDQILVGRATAAHCGMMSSSDAIKLGNIISTGDGTKFLADDFTYKTIQMPDLSTYATKSELSGYLPLSGGTMTGNLIMGTNAISGSKYNIIQAESNGAVNIGATAVTIDLYSDRNLHRKTNSSIYTIYDSGNFIAGTNYLAPGGVSIADVSGLQDSLDGKADLTGNSYKNNNACWGGKKTDGSNVYLALVDTNNNVKIGSPGCGLYLRSSAGIQREVFISETESDFYTVLDTYNFKAGTNYVAPSTLNNYLPLSGGAMSGNITMNGANSNIYLRNSATITGYFGEDALPILYPDAATNRVVLGTVGKPLQVRSNNPIVRTNTNSTEYTIIDTYNTFNTITYTTSASEKNLRAWNNYVNGYVTNLQATDSAVFDLTRQTSGVDKVNRKFEIIIVGGSPRKLNFITYTLAEDGSLTRAQEAFTLTPATT